MADRSIYVDLNFEKVNQIVNARLHNVTTSQRNSLAATLGATNEGLIVYDTDEDQIYVWNSTTFIPTKVQGAMTYKGTVTSLTTAPVGFDVGSTYVFTGTPGTLTWAGQTFSPTSNIEVGDILIYRGSNTWDIVEGNDVAATETVSGNVTLATQGDVNNGTGNGVVTATTLSAFVNSRKLAKTYFASVDLAALTPFTVSHNLGLSNKDAFIVRTATSNGSEVSFDIDSVDTNSFTVTSGVALTGVKVFVTGF